MSKILLSLLRSINNFAYYRCSIYKSHFLKRCYKYVVSHSGILKKPVYVNGNKVFLDPEDSLGLLARGVCEPLQTEVTRKLVKKGDVVLDLGANIGYYTLLLASLVGENGRVFAFEASPRVFPYLERNVKVNAYKNVTVVRKAVWDTNERLKLFVKPDSYASDSIGGADVLPYETIDAIKLDDYFKDMDYEIDFIKMDIEGAEGKALMGMESLLAKCPNLKMAIEFWPKGLKMCGTESREFINRLVSLGIKPLLQINEGRGKVETFNVNDIVHQYDPENEWATTIICARDAQIADLCK